MPSLRLCRAQTIFRRRQHDLHSLRLEIAIHTKKIQSQSNGSSTTYNTNGNRSHAIRA